MSSLVIGAVVRAPAPAWSVEALQAGLLVLVAAGATLVVLTRRPVRQVVMVSGYGLLLTLLFFSLQAPDVALSMLTVGTVLLPLILLLSLAKLKGQGK